MLRDTPPQFIEVLTHCSHISIRQRTSRFQILLDLHLDNLIVPKMVSMSIFAGVSLVSMMAGYSLAVALPEAPREVHANVARDAKEVFDLKDVRRINDQRSYDISFLIRI